MDDIASVNFFYVNIVHVEGSAYAHSTDFQTDRQTTDRRAIAYSEREPITSLGRGPPPYQVASWSIEVFGHTRHTQNSGGAPFWGGAVSPSWWLF